MKSNSRHWGKPVAVLFTGGLIFGTGGTCVPEDPLFKLGASSRALVFDTFAIIVANGINDTINGAIFGTDAVDDVSGGDDGLMGGDAPGSGNPGDEPPPFP